MICCRGVAIGGTGAAGDSSLSANSACLTSDAAPLMGSGGREQEGQGLGTICHHGRKCSFYQPLLKAAGKSPVWERVH